MVDLSERDSMHDLIVPAIRTESHSEAQVVILSHLSIVKSGNHDNIVGEEVCISLAFEIALDCGSRALCHAEGSCDGVESDIADLCDWHEDTRSFTNKRTVSELDITVRAHPVVLDGWGSGGIVEPVDGLVGHSGAVEVDAGVARLKSEFDIEGLHSWQDLSVRELTDTLDRVLEAGAVKASRLSADDQVAILGVEEGDGFEGVHRGEFTNHWAVHNLLDHQW